MPAAAGVGAVTGGVVAGVALRRRHSGHGHLRQAWNAVSDLGSGLRSPAAALPAPLRPASRSPLAARSLPLLPVSRPSVSRPSLHLPGRAVRRSRWSPLTS